MTIACDQGRGRGPMPESHSVFLRVFDVTSAQLRELERYLPTPLRSRILRDWAASLFELDVVRISECVARLRAAGVRGTSLELIVSRIGRPARVMADVSVDLVAFCRELGAPLRFSLTAWPMASRNRRPDGPSVSGGVATSTPNQSLGSDGDGLRATLVCESEADVWKGKSKASPAHSRFVEPGRPSNEGRLPLERVNELALLFWWRRKRHCFFRSRVALEWTGAPRTSVLTVPWRWVTLAHRLQVGLQLGIAPGSRVTGRGTAQSGGA